MVNTPLPPTLVSPGHSSSSSTSSRRGRGIGARNVLWPSSPNGVSSRSSSVFRLPVVANPVVTKPFLLALVGCSLVLLAAQVRVLTVTTSASPPRVLVSPSLFSNSVNSLSHLRSTHHQSQKSAPSPSSPSSSSSSSTSSTSTASHSSCRFYLAESAIPNSGLGIFTAVGLHPGDHYLPDICLFVSDLPPDERQWMHLRTHTFGRNSFFGQSEGRINRAACPGMITNFNTVPDRLLNSKIVTGVLPTNGGLHRDTSPGAGASTPHFGIHGMATDIVTAGSELTVYYGDWDFDETKQPYVKPERPVEWLREHGWCIDNIEVLPATDPSMGRGAFARYPLVQGQVVAPAPLQAFRDRAVFAIHNYDDGTNNGNNKNHSTTEQLLLNYALQPKHSKMVFFPYGQGVALVNHNHYNPNVKWQWSQHPEHHASWLNLSKKSDFWKVAKPGGLILELVALRDIDQGEELLVDYGPDWDAAWQAHVAAWKPPSNEPSATYAYPADMDETLPLRTSNEQLTNPYPSNLLTSCVTGDWSDRSSPPGRTRPWREPSWDWWYSMTPCHILDRYLGPKGDPVYTVSLLFKNDPHIWESYDPTHANRDQWYIDTDVPRRAIRFIEKPYRDDEHLPGAFRHPMRFPDELVPPLWLDDDNDSQTE